MVKLFVTGDNHFGMKYGGFHEFGEDLIQSRYDSLEKMVEKAEEEDCSFFAITGDLFDSTSVTKKIVEKVVGILNKFTGKVVVLPGNHDFYTGNENVWKFFNGAISGSNIVLLNEYKEYTVNSDDETIVFYPAYCDSKHSKDNRLGWIKGADLDDAAINIGLAHGSVKGYSPDNRNEYFMMTPEELNDIPVDVWLIGHTHVPFPDTLKEDEYTEKYKIFNPGTHEQTDISNNTEGVSFIISIEKEDNIAKVRAKKFVSGQIRYHNIELNLSPDSDNVLEETLKNAVSQISKNSVIRVKLTGSVKPEEFENRGEIYKSVLKGFRIDKITDNELSEEITVDKIRKEYPETSFAAKFLETIDNSTELQMAYDLIKSIKE